MDACCGAGALGDGAVVPVFWIRVRSEEEEREREFYLGLGNGEEREREKGGLEGLTRLPFAEKIAASLLAFVGLIERAE